MIARSTLRWFFWVSCAFVAFFCARTAEAHAPMCDARGMSVDAPPPMTPIRDARIERGSAPCRDAAPVLELGHQVKRVRTVVDGGCIESWMCLSREPLPAPASVCGRRVASAGLDKSPGYENGVFRPPRAA